MKTRVLPSTAWAIVDTLDNTVMEHSWTGQMNIFYAQVDAEASFSKVQKGTDVPTAKRLTIREIQLRNMASANPHPVGWPHHR